MEGARHGKEAVSGFWWRIRIIVTLWMAFAMGGWVFGIYRYPLVAMTWQADVAEQIGHPQTVWLPGDGTRLVPEVITWLNHLTPQERGWLRQRAHRLAWWPLEGASAAILIGGFALGWNHRRTRRKKLSRRAHVRGRMIVSTRDLNRSLRGWRPWWLPRRRSIWIGGISLPSRYENRHILLTGATGAGKTVALRRIIKRLRARGDIVVCVDAGGELMSEYGRDTDVILSPIDARSFSWDPVKEARTVADLPRIALSLIPKEPGGDAEIWAGYARALVAAAIGKAGNLEDLANMLISAPSYPVDTETADGTSLQERLSDTPAARLFEAGSSRMLSSIRSITATSLSWLSVAAGCTGEQWTAREWAVRTAKKETKSWVWLPIRADHAEMLKPHAIAIVQQTITQILSLREDERRRVWIVVDELGAYPQISSLPAAMTQGRKFGVRTVLGMQTVAQLQKAYGREGAQELLSCAGVQLILRSGDAETAAWASKQIGETELQRHSKTEGDMGHSVQTHSTTEAAVLASDLMSLRDRYGYLITPEHHPVAQVRLPIPRRRTGQPPYVEAPWLMGGVTRPNSVLIDRPDDATPEDVLLKGWGHDT